MLTIGAMLPETGSLAFLGPPEIAGAQMAIEDINAAGGVLGADVEYLPGDSGDTSTDIASQTVERHLAAGVDMILGAASSGVTFTVIDAITGAGVIQFSPANTAKALTDYDDNGLYFRTAPSDILQGQVLGNLMAADGCTNAALLALQDPYGEGLLEDTSAAFTAAGGTAAAEIMYDPQAQNYDAEVQQVIAAAPDCTVVIGFEESALILQGLLEQGLAPDSFYGVDGNMSNTLDDQVDPNNPAVLQGMTGTTPLPAENDEFFARLQEFEPTLEDVLYAAETYDAVVITALAAIVAGTDQPTAVAAEINGVTGGGTACASFEECAPLAESGEDIDYQGASGPLEFTDAGEPGQGNYGILQFDDAGECPVIDNVEASF